MVYQPKNPVGYRKLLTWKQAGEIYHKAKDFTGTYLDKYNDKRLIGHIDDSARSVQRNIEEGYKRSTTKEYIQFLGFSRASLEELKGDFEELKREWREGVRWVDKGVEIRGSEAEKIRGCGVEKIRGSQAEEIRGGEAEKMRGSEAEKMRGEAEEVRGGEAGKVRGGAIREIEALLDLIYGEDCMMGRQIMAIEKKMVEEKTAPRGDVIKRAWRKSGSADKKFWHLAETKFGIKRDEKGICRRDEKGIVEKGALRRVSRRGLLRRVSRRGLLRRVEKGVVER